MIGYGAKFYIIGLDDEPIFKIMRFMLTKGVIVKFDEKEYTIREVVINFTRYTDLMSDVDYYIEEK